MGRKRTHTVNPGDRFGRGVVLEEVQLIRGGKPWRGVRLRCDCGTVYETTIYELLRTDRPGTKSCGCLVTRHGLSRHDGTQHPLYQTWSGIMTRCYNEGWKQYKDYGGRGIKVCDRWHDPNAFIEDIELLLGPRPDGLTLDRIDNEGNYEPGNVRWATRTEQNRNTRRYIDGNRNDVLYRTWWGLMHSRKSEVCQRWHDLKQFRDDIDQLLGQRLEGQRFHRLNPEHPYEPGNVAWVTGAEQIKRAQANRHTGPGTRPWQRKDVKLTDHPLYGTWASLRGNYRDLLYEPWQKASQFLVDVEQLLGPRPAQMAFRRIDPDGRFEPGNVCWGPRGRPSRKH